MLNGSYWHHQNFQCLPIAHKFQFKPFCSIFKRSLWLLSLNMFHQFNLQTSTKIKSTFSGFHKAKFISQVSDPHSQLPSHWNTFYFPLLSQSKPFSHIPSSQVACPNHSSFYSFPLLSKTLTHIFYITCYCPSFLGKLVNYTVAFSSIFSMPSPNVWILHTV